MKSADQTGANYTTQTAIAWDAESYDVGGWHDNVTNNTRLTVPSGVSRVRVSAHVRLQNVTANAFASVQIKKNNAIFDGNAKQTVSNNGTTADVEAFSPVIAVSAGDYFEANLQVNGDVSVDVIAAESWFAIEKVS